MSEPRSATGGRRRNVIDTRDARAIVGVAAIVAVVLATVCALAEVSPTGSTTADVVVVGLFGGFVAWAGASAPWWAIVTFAGFATLISGPSWWTLVALAAVAIGLGLGTAKQSAPWLRSAATGLALLALMRADVSAFLSDAFFGCTALIVGISCVAFTVVAISRRPRSIRRRVVWGLAGCAGFVVVAVGGLAAGGLQAKDELQAGRRLLTDGLDQLRAGDTQAAAASLRSAAGELKAATDSVDALWAQPSRLIPIVSHHRALLSQVVASAAESATAAANALDIADIDQLRVINGTVDVQALSLLAQPLADLDVAVANVRQVLADADSPWLLDEVRDQLVEGRTEIDQAVVQSNATAASARYGPAILGIDGTRTYLVVFTSPGEARGQSGLIGNWAEITVTDGRIRQSDFGRTSELIADLTPPGSGDLDPSDLVLAALPEYFERYGPFGAGGAQEGVRPKYWSNVTMSPDAPTVAAVIAQMYAGGANSEVDGVFVIDPTGLAALLRVAGPVTVEGFDQEISADSLEQFLLFDQYKLDEFTRRDLLEAVAGVTLQQFLTADLPEPQQLARTLGPAATEGHIVGWARRPEEQELFRLIGMSGQLPVPQGRDGLAIVTDNAGGNKIDSFLQRTVSYEATFDSDTGQVEATLVVTLQNTAPSTGLPDYVIGNIVGLPKGTNRTLLTVYTPLGVRGVTLDDQPSSVTSGTEQGWNTATVRLDIAAGATRTLRFELTGSVAADQYAFVWRPQPLTRADQVTIDVRSTAGRREVSFTGEIARLTVLDRDGEIALR